jgi:predicted RNase H-like nuclease (RuvC/YqgF family)
MDSMEAIWGAIGTAIGVIGTIIAGLFKARKEDFVAASALRDELRRDNAELRDQITKLQAMVKELGEERLKLKRALDLRDIEIEGLKARVGRLEEISEPLL